MARYNRKDKSTERENNVQMKRMCRDLEKWIERGELNSRKS